MKNRIQLWIGVAVFIISCTLMFVPEHTRTTLKDNIFSSENPHAECIRLEFPSLFDELLKNKTTEKDDSEVKPLQADTSENFASETDSDINTEFVVQEGHMHDITGIAFDPTGKYIVSADTFGKIKLWGTNTGRTFHDDLSKYYPVNHSIGRFAITGTLQNLKIWNLAENNLPDIFKNFNNVEKSPGGRFFVGTGTGGMKLFDTKTFKETHSFWVHTVHKKGRSRKFNRRWKDIVLVKFEPDEEHFVTGNKSGTICRWNLLTRKVEHTFTPGHFGKIIALEIDRSGKFLLTAGSKDNYIRIWDIKNCRLLKTIEAVPQGYYQNNSLNSLAVDPKWRYVVSGDSIGNIRVFSLENGSLVHCIKRPGKSTLNISHYERGVRVRQPIIGYNDTTVLALAIDPEGRFIVSGRRKGTLREWNLETGKLIKKLSGLYDETDSTPEFSPKLYEAADKPMIHQITSDMKFVAVKTDKKEFSIWNLESCKLQKHIPKGVALCEFDPYGRFLITADAEEDIIKVYDLKSGAMLHKLRSPQDMKRKIKWMMTDPRGRRIISMHEGLGRGIMGTHIFNIWDIETGKLIKSVKRCFRVQISPKGDYIAGHKYVSDGYEVINSKLNVWSLDSGELLRTFTLKSGFNDAFIDFIRNGEIVVIGGYQVSFNKNVILKGGKRRLFLWNIKSGNRLQSPEVGEEHLKERTETDPSGRFVIYSPTEDRTFNYDLTDRIPKRYEDNTQFFHHHYFSFDRYSNSYYDETSGKWKTISRNPSHTDAVVWDIDKGRIAVHITGHSSELITVETDPAGKFAVSVSESAIKVWDTASGKLLKTLEPEYKIKMVPEFSASGFASGKFLKTLEPEYKIKMIAIDPRGNYIVAGTSAGLYVWDLHSGELANKITIGYYIKKLHVINNASLSDQPVILVYEGNIFTITELLSDRQLFNEEITPKKIKENFILSGNNHNELNLWNIKTGEYLILVSGGKEWLVYNSKGYFDSSRYGSLAAMTKGANVFGIDQFAIRNNRPDILLKNMELGNDELIAHFNRQYRTRLKKFGFTHEQLSGSLHVPEAEIVAVKQDSKFVEIELQLKDSKYDLKTYNIYINDVPVFTDTGKDITGNSAVLSEKIELSPGKNKIEVSCTNIKGAESYRALTSADYNVKIKGDLYYIGFGVSEYKNRDLNLKYPDKDAEDIKNMFLQMKGTYYNNIWFRTFVNEDATVENIRRAKELLRNATVDDTFILFIAGHGVHDTDIGATYYYLTHGADMDNLAKTAAPFDMFDDLLRDIAPRKKLFLIDTCESGELDEDVQNRYLARAGAGGFRARTTRAVRIRPKNIKKRPFLLDRNRYIYNELIRRSGAVVFSSSRGGELSYESDELGNGFFTAEIINALGTDNADKNRDGFVSTDEMQNYVIKAVSGLSSDLQHPTVDRSNIYQKILFPVIQKK